MWAWVMGRGVGWCVLELKQQVIVPTARTQPPCFPSDRRAASISAGARTRGLPSGVYGDAAHVLEHVQEIVLGAAGL